MERRDLSSREVSYAEMERFVASDTAMKDKFGEAVKEDNNCRPSLRFFFSCSILMFDQVQPLMRFMILFRLLIRIST